MLLKIVGLRKVVEITTLPDAMGGISIGSGCRSDIDGSDSKK